MAGAARRIFLASGMALAATVLAAVGVDRGVAWKGLDRERMALSLYAQRAYMPVHQESADPVLHYELRPGASMSGTGKYGPFQVHINTHGARGEEHPAEKAPGVFRILCFGPSSTFGADVDDDESIPARLQAWLQARAAAQGGGPTVEVWNFGTSAYVPIQSAHLARKKLAELDPDLLLMVFNNGGRRAFLVPDQESWDPRPWLQADPSLWAENFPSPDPRLGGLHSLLLRGSAFYRYLVAQKVLDRSLELHPDQTRPLVDEIVGGLRADARAAGVDLVVVSWHRENLHNFQGLAEADHIGVFPALRDVYDAHPPASVLDQVAARIGSSLVAQGRIDGLSPEGVEPLPVVVDDLTLAGGKLPPPGAPRPGAPPPGGAPTGGAPTGGAR